jgi:sarcosine oxidase
MGSSTAYQLSSTGARVLGLERFGPAHAHGSSHGGSRIIRQAYAEDPDYVPIVLRAYDLWRRLERDSGSAVLHITGGLHIGASDSRLVLGCQRSACQHGLVYEVLDSREIRRRFPVFQPSDTEVGVYEPNAGYLIPELAIQSFLRIATRQGAHLHFHEPVNDWEVSPTGTVRVTTPTASYEAAKLVISPGAWAPAMFSDLGLPLVVRRHVMAWFEPAGGIGPFSPERLPIYMWQTSPETLFYGFPAIDGAEGGAKVAIHTGGDRCSWDTIDRNITAEDEAMLRDQIASRIPSLNGPLLSASTCIYTLTPDEHFVIGLHPQFPQVTVVCGFSGHGFKFASAVGEIAAELALHGTSRHGIEFCSPLRFGTGNDWHNR